jgi:hypothetical protein
MRIKYLQIINLVAFVALAVFNFAAVRTPFFGRRPGAVSDLYPNPFTPPDFSFKIWPIIYTLLGIFAVHQASSLFDKNKSAPKEVREIGLLFLLTCLLNFIWLISWQSLHLPFSFVINVALWATLILIYYRLSPFSGSNWMFSLPFSWYLAWVAVAGLANLNVVLMDGGFGFFGLSPEAVAVWFCGIGIFGGLLVLYLNRDWWFTLVLLWALLGIYMKNGEGMVATACLIGMGILTLAGGRVAWQKLARP